MINPINGPNNNPPIWINIPSIITLNPGYALKTIPRSPEVITVNSMIMEIDNEIVIAILVIPLILIRGTM